MKCALLRCDTGAPFVADAELVVNPDTSVSFRLPNGAGWAGQAASNDPNVNVYGVRHPDQPPGEVPGAYQRATLDGKQVVFVTREQDPPMIYVIGFGKAY